MTAESKRIAVLEAELADERRRHRELRQRKAVRAALAVAGARHTARAALARRVAAARTARASHPTPPEHRLKAEQAAPRTIDGVAHVWEVGHFYSPVPDTLELARQPTRSRVRPATPRQTPGVEWRGDAQVELVRALAAQAPFPFPSVETGNPADYHTGNPNFSALDAWALQGMLRHLKPSRVVEVGCGWSSLVTARVNRECFRGALHVTCIEPHPPDFLAGGIDGIAHLIDAPVEELPLSTFEALDDGDVLFIDTSHVVKTGNDVQFLFQEVVPRLRPGVVVHVHDIFLPREYPEHWVFEGRAWNEQYLVESFLAFNTAFEVQLGIGWLSAHRPDVLAAAAGDAVVGGGCSMWLRRRR